MTLTANPIKLSALLSVLLLPSSYAAGLVLTFSGIDNRSGSGTVAISGDLSGTGSFTQTTTDGSHTTINVHTFVITGDFSDNGQVDSDQITFVLNAQRSSSNQSNTTVRWAPGTNVSTTFSSGGGSITYADATYDPSNVSEIQFGEFISIDADRGVSSYNGSNFDGGSNGGADDVTIPLSGSSVTITNANVASPNDGGASNSGWISDLSFTVNVTPVPEPSSTVLLGLGSLGLLARRRR